jgi:hypothetical protein
VIQKRRAAASVRQYVPGVFVFLIVALPPVAVIWTPAAWLWLAAGGSYLFCTLAVSISMAARHGWQFIATLPPVFACYHFGYGCGFLHGLWDFVLSRRSPSGFQSALTRSAAGSSHTPHS